MPDAGYFGLTYELLFVGDADWTDITPLVDSRQTKVSDAGCSEDLKSVINKCSIEMRYGTDSAKQTHANLVGKLLTAKSAGTVVRFRMSGIDSFVGKVDLGNFDQKNGRIPGFVTLDCEDNSYLLDEKMANDFEYPASDDLDHAGYSVFDKANLAESIVMLRFLDAGYTIDDIDIDGSDSIDEKVRRIVYDADNERTYRDFLDTLLFEHCAVVYLTPQGKLSVRRLYRESPTSERTVDHFLVKDGIATGGGDYQFDGVKVIWSNLGKLLGAVVYNANITTEVDDEGNFVGEEIQPESYWPQDGDINETWQEFNATFLDREYQTKVSRIKNKDLSLISVKNAYYEVDKDADVILANNPPEIKPTKARVLFYNKHTTDVKKIYGFTIVGDALFRNKLNESIYPTDAKRLDDPYESEFVYTSEVATKLANHLYRFRKYGDLQHRWAEIDIDTPMFQIVTVSAPDTLISSLAMVISQTRTYPAPGKIKRFNSAIGVTAFNSEPVKTRSIQLGGAPVNTGPAGSSGTKSVVQFILGTADAPYSDAGVVVGTSFARVGTTLALVGVEGADWLYDAPTPDVGEFVWRREGYYTPPELWPKVWNITRMTGASAFGLTLHASALTIPTTSRGVPYGGDITISAIFQNIPDTYEITWGIVGASFVDAGTNQTKVVEVDTVTANSVVVTASVLFGGVTYSDMVTLEKVADGKPAPMNFRGVTSVPTETPDGEPLVKGDYFLWAGTTTEDYTKGKIYEYSGSAWVESTNGDLVMTMFDSFADLANDVDSTVIGNAVIKKLVALDAVVQNLVAQNLRVKEGDYALPDTLSFDGIDDYVSIPYNSALYPPQLRIEVSGYRTNWQAESSQGKRLISCAQDGGWSIYVTETNLGFNAYINGAYLRCEYPVSSISAGWHDIVGTYDGRYLKLYVDTVLVDTEDAGASYPITYSITDGILIGADIGDDGVPTPDSFYAGYLKDIAIYSDAGGTTQIASWEMQEGTGATVHDSENSHDGTIHGATWISENGNGFEFHALTSDDNGRPRFGVLYDGRPIFVVEPDTGKIYFGEHFWYDPSDGAIHTPNDKTVINADGTIEAESGTFSGYIEASSGLFKGIFDTTALKLEPGDATSLALNVLASDINQAMTICNYFVENGELEYSYSLYYAATATGGIVTFKTYEDGYLQSTETVNLSDVKYVRFTHPSTGFGVWFYDSNFYNFAHLWTTGGTTPKKTIIVSVNFTLTVWYGGDKLLLSSDTPISPSGLSDYQIYIEPDTGIMKVKLP